MINFAKIFVMNLGRFKIGFRSLITLRLLLSNFLIFLFLFELSGLLEYKFYLSHYLRFVFATLVGISITFFLLLFLLTFFIPEKFYFFFRSFLQRFSTLYDLYQFLNQMQLRKSLGSILGNKNRLSTELEIKSKNNISYYDYLIMGLTSLLLVNLFFHHENISKGFYRVYNYNISFSKPDLLKYILEPRILEIDEGNDFMIKGVIIGKYYPEYIIIRYNNIPYQVKVDRNSFNFIFKNVTENITFSIESKSLNHFSTYTIVCRSKTYFENYWCYLSYPKYLNKKSDTIYDISSLSVPEYSDITYHLQWHGKGNFHFNDSLIKTENNRFVYKVHEAKNNCLFSFQLFFDDSLKDNLTSKIYLITDNKPSITLQQGLFKNSVTINYNDDYGLRTGGFYFIKFINDKSVTFGKNSFSLKDLKTYDVVLRDLDTITAYDSVKIIAFIKDNCSFRDQSIERSFSLFTSDDRFKTSLQSIDSIVINTQTGLRNLNNILYNVNQLLNNTQKDFKSNYINNTSREQLKENVDQLKNLLKYSNNNDISRLSKILDSLVQELTFPDLNQNYINFKIEELKKIKELSALVQEALKKEIKYSSEQILELLTKEIENQIKEINKLSENISDTLSSNNLFQRIDKLAKGHNKLSELNSKLGDNNFKDLQKKISDTLNDINKIYQNMKLENAMEATSHKLSKINQKYRNIKELIQLFQKQNEHESKFIDYSQVVTLIKKGNLISQKAEKSISTLNFLSYGTRNNISLNDFSYTEKAWMSYRDSLLLFVKNNELPTSYFIEQVYIIDKSKELYTKAIKSLNRLEASRNAGAIMESLNKINLLLSELLNTKEDNNSMQMDGQQCMKPRKGGNKGKPKPSSSMADILKQLDELQQKMNQKAGQTGNKPSTLNGKELLEMINQQQMIRDALSEMISKAENKELSKSLQEAIDEMKKNEKQMLDRRMLDNAIINRNVQIKTRLLEALKAKEEQDFDNQRTSRDFGKYFRQWNENNNRKQEVDIKSVNELLKPIPVGIRKYYFEKDLIYRQK